MEFFRNQLAKGTIAGHPKYPNIFDADWNLAD